MPRAPRICSQPGCPQQAGANARCQQHQPKAWANTTRLSTRHQSWRRAVLNRDDHTCQRCGAPATEADHIVPRSVAPHLELDVDNGQALCSPCHKIKTRAEANAARAARSK